MAYENLTSTENKNSGLANKIYVAPVRYFDEGGIKGPASGNDIGEITVIDDDHVFLEGKGFIEINTAPFRNELNAPTIGEVGSLSLDQSLTVNVLGNDARLHGTVKKMLNEQVIVLIGGVDCVNEPLIQLGSECVNAYISEVEYTSGTLKDGQKGYSITFNTVGGGILQYNGEVEVIED